MFAKLSYPRLWLLATLLLTTTWRSVEELPMNQQELQRMRQKWMECCQKNETMCLRGSCYSMEWRAAAWASVRNRCRSRYADWPFAVDILRVQKEDDIEALWSLLSRANAYSNADSVLPTTVWTSGTRCPERGPTGLVVSTRWASNRTFPSWLEEKVKGTPSGGNGSDEECKFLVISPQANRTVKYDFQKEDAQHAAICEFLFPEEIEWSSTTRSSVAVSPTSSERWTWTWLPQETSTETSSISGIATNEVSVTTEMTPNTTDETTTRIVAISDITWEVTKNGSNDVTGETDTVIFEEERNSTDAGFLTTEMTSSGAENGTTNISISENDTNSSGEGKNGIVTSPLTGETEEDTLSVSERTEPFSNFDTDITADLTTSSKRTKSGSYAEDTSTSTTSDRPFTDWTIEVSEDWEALSSVCKGKEVRGIHFEDTLAGHEAKATCPEGMEGFVLWKCDEKTLEFTPKEPPVHECKSKWINSIHEEIAAGGDALDLSLKLVNKIKETPLSFGDITSLMNLTEDLQNLFDKQLNEVSEEDRPVVVYNFSSTLVTTFSNLLETKGESWKDLPKKEKKRDASKILRQVTSVGQRLSCEKVSSDELQHTLAEDNIDLQTFVFDESRMNISRIFPKSLKELRSSSSLTLPRNLSFDLWSSPCGSLKTAVGVIYKHIGDFLKDDTTKAMGTFASQVMSPVVSFSLGNSTTETLFLPEGLDVSIVLEHNKQSDLLVKNPRCVFWNFSSGYSGEWDETGCETGPSNATHTECSCTHLTNFAVLMDVSNVINKDDKILQMMTVVCCGISTIALVATLCCLLGIRSMYCRRSTITSNLCVCLLFVNILILGGLDKAEKAQPWLCATIAGVLHYSILAAFFWMLLEGYQLYQMVVLVFSRSSQMPIYWLYVFGYGMPMIIVVTSVIVRHEDYGGTKFCWLSNENNLMWSFVGPASAVILINLVIFVLTIRSASSVKIRKEQTTANNARGWIKGSLSILCLLGLTWCMGLFYTNKNMQFFSYLFTIFNGLQGVFIFVFHVLLNEKANTFFLRLFGKKIKREATKTQYLHGTSSNARLRARLSQATSVNSVARTTSSQSLGRFSSRPSSAQSLCNHSRMSSTQSINQQNLRPTHIQT